MAAKFNIQIYPVWRVSNKGKKSLLPITNQPSRKHDKTMMINFMKEIWGLLDGTGGISGLLDCICE